MFIAILITIAIVGLIFLGIEIIHNNPKLEEVDEDEDHKCSTEIPKYKK